MSVALRESSLPLPLLRRGKVREVYEAGDGLILLVASDRVSAFDVVMDEPVPLKGAVIVSTPQDLALIDARRGIAMFKRVDVPVLGIVENMSYFQCPQCGTRSDIFGHGGARHEAERLGVPFLGEVPLHATIREKSDSGLPVVATEPDGAHARISSRRLDRTLRRRGPHP